MTPIQVDDAINEAVENVAYVNNLSSDSSLVLADAESLGGLPAENYATKNYVVDTINQAQLGGDNSEVDLSIYATKDDLTLVSNAIPTTPEEIGARPNTWMPTIAEIGAAPAGYGLGTNTVDKSTIDGMAQSGFYHGKITEPATKYSGNTYGEHIQYSNKYAYQRLIGMKASTGITEGTVRRRYKDNGTWSEIEYENPPMIPGVEYRTTERYNGEPVYTKLLNLGAVTGTNVTIEAEHEVVGRIISATASAGYWIAPGIPKGGLTGDALTVFTDNVKVYVTSYGSWGGMPDTYALLKYVKN